MSTEEAVDDITRLQKCASLIDTEVSEAFQLVIPFLENRDRISVSVVCWRLYQIEAMTREHVKIGLCYSAKPAQLTKRFPNLKSVRLNGRPKDLFDVIPRNWGGIGKPWVDEFSTSYNLKSLSMGRMIITDDDIHTLSGKTTLEVLILEECSGFSTDGLLHIARNCRKLKTLSLEESVIDEKDGKWLHEMSLNNNVLENLNFYKTNLSEVNFKDLQVIGRNCHNLMSVKIISCGLLDLVDFLKEAKGLEEFVGGSFDSPPTLAGEDGAKEQLQKYGVVPFPQKLHHLELPCLGNDEMALFYPIAARLKKLDLSSAILDPPGYCVLLARCHNLESLQARNIIGDAGLEVVARSCKKLKRITIERSMKYEEQTVSHRGLIALARECTELEHLTIFVCDITNKALECVGTNLKNLSRFMLFLINDEQDITDFPLDTGICSLLRGCQKLRRFGLYLREGGLSDIGLKNIGKFSTNIRSMLLGLLGESDEGLLDFSRGCPNLKKLELRGDSFSEQAIATAVLNLKSLKYLWVQGYMASEDGHDLLAMARPYWNIELIPPRRIVHYDTDGDICDWSKRRGGVS